MSHKKIRTSHVYILECSDEAEIMDTISFEKQVKGWHRENKEALINGDYD